MKLRLISRLRATVAVAASLSCLSTPLLAEPDAGAYLAARQAGLDGDYASAAEFYHEALIADSSNLTLLGQAMAAFLGTGQIDNAAELGKTLIDAGGESQIANIAIMAQSAKAEDWNAIFSQLEAGHEVGPFLDGLVQAWAYVGQGRKDNALDSFDELIVTSGMRAFGLHHKAMALTMMGDLEAANAIYSLPANQGFTPTRASVIAHIQILSRLGDFDRATALVERVFASDPSADARVLVDAIEAKQVPVMDNTVTTPVEGIAFAFQELTEVLQGDASDSYLLLYAQSARYIAPENANTHLITARILNTLEQFDAAAQTFGNVSPDNAAYTSAEMGRAEALRRAGRFEQAIEVLKQLSRVQPDQIMAFGSLGDIYRRQKDFENARAAYDRALQDLDEDAPARWWLLYSRGITSERLDLWNDAERDFRAALELNPQNPSILNYLGYSLVDRGLKYEEALGMIETAVELRPDNGAIIDSLAWVYFKLGRFESAVAPMERAVELLPNDPIISDHLGDIYWMVGRETEARFQWRRALSFNPEEDDAVLIRRKLEIGLVAANAEEGVDTPSIEVANDAN